MRELAELQETFAAALADAAQAPRAASLLFRGAPAGTVERIAIYRGNIVANACKALANAYPITVKIVGDKFFDGLASEYLRRHPSVSGDLNKHGSELAHFVAKFPHTQDLPYLPDVACLEWLAHRAHYAADAPPFDAARLASIAESAWGELRPVLAPACALLESQWPLARIWEVHQDDYSGEFAVDFDAGPDRVLIQRPRFRVHVASVSTGAFRFLQHAAGGDTVGVALAAALAAESGFDFPAALGGWVAAGVIVGFEPHAA
jgi:uncharacterized protein